MWRSSYRGCAGPGGCRRAPHQPYATQGQHREQDPFLPVIPLRQAVLFPGVTVPISAGRPATLAAIEAAPRGPSACVRFHPARGRRSRAPEILHTIGTIARTCRCSAAHPECNSSSTASAGGRTAHRPARRSPRGDRAEAEEMPPLDAQAPTYLALSAKCASGPPSWAESRPPARGGPALPRRGRRPRPVCGRRRHHLDSLGERQALLETLSVEDRLRRVLLTCSARSPSSTPRRTSSRGPGRAGRAAARDLPARAAQGDPTELGDGDKANEADELRAKLAALPCPRPRARKSIASWRGSSARRASRWRRRSSAPTSRPSRSCRGATYRGAARPPRAGEVLERDHYGLGDVKDRVLEFLAVRACAPRDRRRRRQAPAPGTKRPGAGADPAVRRPAGRGQDLGGALIAGDGARVRAHLARRRA